jgi:peptidoglycan/xylan/chitin deacetylase (PgdA/CDA1 family)
MPLHLLHRRFALMSMLLAFLLCALALIARGMNPPRFVLDQASDSIRQADSQAWRRAGDWLAGRKYAVLTFDDGPYGHGLDEVILGILNKHHAHAMFFLECRNITADTRNVLGKFERAGDLIGNHTYDHPDLTKLSPAQVTDQIERCNQRIAAVTGKRPYYFRPPFGATTPAIAKMAHAHGMAQMLWNANSQDSWMTRPNQIMTFTMAQTDDQSIVLLHERPTTAAVLDRLLTRLEQEGFQFVLPDQLASGNQAID